MCETLCCVASTHGWVRIVSSGLKMLLGCNGGKLQVARLVHSPAARRLGVNSACACKALEQLETRGGYGRLPAQEHGLGICFCTPGGVGGN